MWVILFIFIKSKRGFILLKDTSLTFLSKFRKAPYPEITEKRNNFKNPTGPRLA